MARKNGKMIMGKKKEKKKIEINNGQNNRNAIKI